MLSKSQKDAVLRQLRELFEAMSDEASRNPDFLDKIASILLCKDSDLATQQKAGTSARGPSLNIVEILHRDGDAAAREALGRMTNDELVKLAVADGVKKSKDAKSMERESLIGLLLQTAENRLRQGESFTKG